MDKVIKSFVTDKFPEFVVSEHDKFKLFVEAYYEWLEKDNTGTYTSVTELYKGLPNPGGLVANADVLRDIDDTLDGFIDYFRREVIPVVIDDNKTTNRFFIKKVRDLYLSKGTPKSFKLLFRLLFDEDIEIFETKNDILKASYGQYIEFPVVYFQVIAYPENLATLDFTLARITDLDRTDVGTILSGVVAGEDSDLRPVIKAQLGETYSFKAGNKFYVYDVNDVNSFVQVQILPALEHIIPLDGGSLYAVGDEIIVSSKKFNRSYSAKVANVSSGPVEHLFVRNRGFFYSVGDTLTFTHPNQQFGSGGGASVSEVDTSGRVTAIDGIPLRTGDANSGYISNRFEDVKIPVANGGAWRRIPSTAVNSKKVSFGLPYGGENVTGTDLQVTPVSRSIGTIAELFFVEKPFFTDSDDVEVNTPLNVVVQNFEGIESGAIVSFQKFVPIGNSFHNDSDNISFNIELKRKAGDNSWRTLSVKVPYDFDFDTFQWKTFNATVDSDLGLDSIVTQFAAVKNSKFLHAYTDSGDTQKLAVAITRSTSIDTTEFSRLEKYHYDKLAIALNKDSDATFSWQYTYMPFVDGDGILDVGGWQDIQPPRYARVKSVRAEEGVLSLVPVLGLKSVDSEGYVDIKSSDYKQIIRIAQVDARLNFDSDRNLPFKNIVAQCSKAKFKVSLNGAVYTNKAFADEKGFLNSVSGGTLQDNFFYSDYTYIIQTKVPIERWRHRVKTLLHPAGTQMLAQLVVEQSANITSGLRANTEVTSTINSAMTFDTSLEHYDEDIDFSLASADNIFYTTNPFEIVGDYFIKGKEITADLFFEKSQKQYNFQKGDSWWDYEPLGLVATNTTQTSSGGIVTENQKNFDRYDSAHKNSRALNVNRPLLTQTSFTNDSINNNYYAYTDVDYTTHYATFADSDRQFATIDYTQIYQTNRQIRAAKVLRKKELRAEYERDFGHAVKGTFTYKDNQTGTLKNFDAFESKWNTINSNRDFNLGWEVIGYSSHIQNHSNNKRIKTDSLRTTLTKTPLKEDTYSLGSWYIVNSYQPTINRFDVYSYDQLTTSPTPSNDPAVISKNRKLT